jgi:hypothetical protein
VESAVGRGTMFRIYLPRVQAAVEEVKLTPPRPVQQIGRATVLWVSYFLLPMAVYTVLFTPSYDHARVFWVGITSRAVTTYQ